MASHRREAELSDGHAAYRYCGYVTVTARGPEELETACGEVLQAAHQCRLELRRLYGAQDVAFTWTLPDRPGSLGPMTALVPAAHRGTTAQLQALYPFVAEPGLGAHGRLHRPGPARRRLCL